MLTKSNVYDSLKALPESFTIDELLDHLTFIQNVEAGLKDSIEGKTCSSEEVKDKLKKWL